MPVPSPWQITPQQEATLRALRGKVSSLELYAAVGVSKTVVRRWIQELGLPPLRAKKTTDDVPANPAEAAASHDWARAGRGYEPLPALHPIACQVLVDAGLPDPRSAP